MTAAGTGGAGDQEVSTSLASQEHATLNQPAQVSAAQTAPVKQTWRLSNEDRDDMVSLRAAGWSLKRIAEHFGVHHTTVVSAIRTRENRAKIRADRDAALAEYADDANMALAKAAGMAIERLDRLANDPSVPPAVQARAAAEIVAWSAKYQTALSVARHVEAVSAAQRRALGVE